MSESTASITKESAVTLSQVNSLIDKISEKNPDFDDPRPKEVPPQNISLEELKNNLSRWQTLRNTGCQHMQEFIAYVQSNGDAPWYYKGILDGIQEIVDGGTMYDAEGKINPERARALRLKFRSQMV